MKLEDHVPCKYASAVLCKQCTVNAYPASINLCQKIKEVYFHVQYTVIKEG